MKVILLVFDARHHGSSDGDAFASRPKFSEDIRAAVDFNAKYRNPAPANVGVLGLSVGGSAAIHASAHDSRIAAVATAGAFANPRDPRATLGRFWWVLGPGLPLAFRFVEWRIGLRFRAIAPENVIHGARARFLLIHGTADTVMPPRPRLPPRRRRGSRRASLDHPRARPLGSASRSCHGPDPHGVLPGGSGQPTLEQRLPMKGSGEVEVPSGGTKEGPAHQWDKALGV